MYFPTITASCPTFFSGLVVSFIQSAFTGHQTTTRHCSGDVGTIWSLFYIAPHQCFSKCCLWDRHHHNQWIPRFHPGSTYQNFWRWFSAYYNYVLVWKTDCFLKQIPYGMVNYCKDTWVLIMEKNRRSHSSLGAGVQSWLAQDGVSVANRLLSAPNSPLDIWLQ